MINQATPKTIYGECEVSGCGRKNTLTNFMTILMCPDCLIKERAAQEELAANAESRVEQASESWRERAKKVDTTIQVKTDLFNAATVAIVELKASIDNDPTVEADKKNFTLAKILEERFLHLKTALFDLRQLELQASSEQRAIQSQLNELANKLRADELAQIKLADINYKPLAIAVAKTKIPKAPTTSKKLDKAELRKAALELNMPSAETLITMTCSARNCSIQDAVNILRKSTAEAASEFSETVPESEPIIDATTKETISAPTFTCPTCNDTFEFESAYKLHVVLKHGV